MLFPPIYSPLSNGCGFKSFLKLGWMGYGGGGTPDMENEIYELHAGRYPFSTAKKNQSKLDGCVSWHLSCNT